MLLSKVFLPVDVVYKCTELHISSTALQLLEFEPYRERRKVI